MAKLFPYMHLQNFLSDELSAEILAYGISKEHDFEPSQIYVKGVVDLSGFRISSTLRRLGPYESIVQDKLREIIPRMNAELQIARFEVGEIEVQLAAHGDGALFGRHIDTMVHEKSDQPRVISAVYYLHSNPKKFDGGNLRLHTIPIGEEDIQPKDISPDHNSLLVFPSFAPHEVLPVIAPGVEFKDWRFAVNCWIHKA